MDDPTSIHSLIAQHNAKDLLRFITCGNVDDGKSTLIGRMLLDAGAIYDDQLASLETESRKHGTTGRHIDTALLLDGLEDERQQGITIDVAYRYFTASNRKFIIADTPGHEQFTRNMVTGASTAQLAVILVDATKGMSTQTRRHSYLVTLLGIRHLVLAINKMDLVAFDFDVYERIRQDFQSFMSELPACSVCCIPLSALEGDNVTERSSRMPWYSGPALFEHLCSVDTAADLSQTSFRLPIQYVNRPNPSFRGFCGTVLAGSIRSGDPVVALPSGKTTRVKSIVTMDGEIPSASVHDSVTLKLDDEIDLSRGDMLVAPDDLPKTITRAQADMVWMSSHSLVPGKQYWLKHTSRRTACEVTGVLFRTDVNSLKKQDAKTLALNEIGRCSILTADPLVIEPYERNRQTGSFILVDRITHETVAAGMFAEPAKAHGFLGHWDEKSHWKAPERSMSLLSPEARSQKYRQQPFTVLITGLTGSGKTSVAVELERLLFLNGYICMLLDGQLLRTGISRDLGFSAEERSENLRRAAEIAKMVNDSGLICVAAFVAPSAWVRKKAKELIGAERFFQVHLSTDIETCRSRDWTGQYQMADQGEISDFPGVSSGYDPADEADLHFDTKSEPALEIATRILDKLFGRWLDR